ncbi:MAG: hypothetical protein M4D80_21385 [Myxococcota bacterium]|nr:hypothetical protein [Deltaproteobacteria bacterium]MDQ3337723.1 hypothetical protein [Myxococcota bacterium]
MRTLALVLLVGCGGGGTSGEPIMGTVSLTYGDSKPKMVVGAAVQNKNVVGEMLVQIGSDNVDCESYLDVFLDFDVPSGTFVYFRAPKLAGTANGAVSVMKSSSNSVSINEGTGSFTIDTIEPRVTGTITFATVDEDVGNILVAGTFDVKRCF